MKTPKRGSASRGGGWWLLLVLAAAGVALLGWLVVKTSAASALAADSPYVAARIVPDDPRVAFGIAMTEFMTRGGRVTDRSKERARRASIEAPLAEEPFLLAAVDALTKNDRPRAERLLIAARLRDPRTDLTRLLLLDTYLRRNRITEATGEITALSGVAPEAGGLLIGELARLAQSPETRGPLEQALKKNPAFRDRLLAHLADNNADPDLILRIARNVPAAGGASGPQPWQGRLVVSMADQGQIQRAYELWRNFYAPKAPAKKVGVYDGGFQGLPGSGPFSWTFPASPAGIAERTPSRTLQVDYYGRDNAELANQLLMLPPGAHRLSIRAEGDAEGEGSKLSWIVECQPSKARLADLVLRKLTYAPRAMSVNFTVPSSGCSAQWLRLIGTAGEFPKGQAATISAIQVSAAG
ncbi:MAG TPA: hypothetical protein VF662_00110 [Allosphingosinicella sp.]